ncbi:MAG: hypothetical protein KDB18_10210 [Salinibacterium sp.]|nr:hypothetical protein [Salinibacterium sp.]
MTDRVTTEQANEIADRIKANASPNWASENRANMDADAIITLADDRDEQASERSRYESLYTRADEAYRDATARAEKAEADRDEANAAIEIMRLDRDAAIANCDAQRARAERAERERDEANTKLAQLTVDHTDALQVVKAVAEATPSWDANPNDKVMISMPVWATAQACVLTDDHEPFTPEQVETYTQLALSNAQPNPLLKRLRAQLSTATAECGRLRGALAEMNERFGHFAAGHREGDLDGSPFVALCGLAHMVRKAALAASETKEGAAPTTPEGRGPDDDHFDIDMANDHGDH